MISWFEEHNKLSWMITILGGVLIFYLSSIRLDLSGVSEVGKNVISMTYHVCAFFCFSLFLFISIKRIDYVFILGIIIAIFYGLLDEVHQLFVVGRYFTFLDFFLDATGILFSSFVYFISVKYRQIKIQKL